MKKTMLFHACVFLAMCVSGALLMHVSQSVRRAEREIARLDLSIENEREALRVLNAEWSMLNSPERIEALARRHLDLALPEASRLVSNAESLRALQAEGAAASGLIPVALESQEGASGPRSIPRKPNRVHNEVPQVKEGQGR